MKKIKLYSLIATTALLGLTSCSDDFLSVEPASSIPVDGYYESEEHILEAMAAAYDPMKWYDFFAGWAPLSLVWDSMGDDVYVGGGSTTDQGQIHKISQYNSDSRDNIGGAWTTSYSGIHRANLFLTYAENSSLDEAKKKLYVAEARALRAWYYLVLWKTWGNVPYYTENLVAPFVTRQYTATELYTAVEKDLAEVLDSKVLPMKQEAGQDGRMTQAATAMIYADYVMYQKDQTKYANALGYMKEIINSTKYELVKPEEIWDVKNEWNKEIIFDVNYTSKGGKRTWGEANAAGGTVYPEMIGIDGLSIKCKAGSNHTPEFQSGWGFGSVSKEVYDAFEAGDKRRDLSVLNIYQYAIDKLADGDTVTYGGRYQNTGYFLRKYLPRPGGNDGSVGDGGLNWDYNLHLYRYAETLLNAAELALSSDPTFAQDCFDAVRNRANIGKKAVSLDNIIDERRVEFVGEGKRYFDLVRSDKAPTVLKAGGGVVLTKKAEFKKDKDGKYIVENNTLVWDKANEWGGKAIPEREAWNENKKYIQIPQDEIEATASKGEEFALDQNPK